MRPGVPGLLAQGNAAGMPMMVVTNTFRSLTDQALETIGATHFQGSVCGDEVAVGPPVSGGAIVAGIGGIFLAIAGGVVGLLLVVTGVIILLVRRSRA